MSDEDLNQPNYAADPSHLPNGATDKRRVKPVESAIGTASSKIQLRGGRHEGQLPLKITVKYLSPK